MPHITCANVAGVRNRRKEFLELVYSMGGVFQSKEAQLNVLLFVSLFYSSLFIAFTFLSLNLSQFMKP